MPVEAVAHNSVVIANQVNPSIFTLPWLADQQIIPLDQVQPAPIIAPNVVQLQTAEFHLMVLPDRIQLTPKADEGDRTAEIVQRIMGGIVETLPHTPYTAAGMNFNYVVRLSEGTYPRRNRELFANENPLSRFFAADDARFGAYYSQNYFGCRLKLELKPAHATADRADEFLAFHFNFHKDLSRATAVQEIRELLAHWNEARALSREISGSVEG